MDPVETLDRIATLLERGRAGRYKEEAFRRAADAVRDIPLDELRALVAQAGAEGHVHFLGNVDEPPRPGAAGSNASPTSVCIISATSRAILPQVPARIANAAATSASRSRWLCHGASGCVRSSSAATRSAMFTTPVPARTEYVAAEPSAT